MITVHFCIESYDPKRGGMEESALRLINSLCDDLDIRVVAYIISVPLEDAAPGITTIDISSRISSMVEPLAPPTATNLRERVAEKTRLQVLLLRQEMRRLIKGSSGGRHVLLSYYLSTAGFVAQHVSSELGIPHIACARGSDLGRDIFTRDGLAAVEFVLRRAACIVTTSLEHDRFVRYLRDRPDDVYTLYNAVPAGVCPKWRRWRTDSVRLVSLGGYSVKKGTLTLLRAVSRLLDEDLPVELVITGPSGNGHWDEIRRRYTSRYGNKVSLEAMIARSEVEAFLLSGDVYCSASVSEGCANATMLAVGLGMPILSTATGALADFVIGLDHIALVEAGDEEGFSTSLRNVVMRVLQGKMTVNISQVESLLDRLSLQREKTAWLGLFDRYATGVAAGTVSSASSRIM